jgi:hypothetical protein
MKKLLALAVCAGLLGAGAASAQDIGGYESRDECLETADSLEKLHGTRMVCLRNGGDGLYYLHPIMPGSDRPKKPRKPRRPR